MTARWLAVYVTGLVGFVFPPLMVAAYCAATVYFELNPRRAQEMLNSPGR